MPASTAAAIGAHPMGQGGRGPNARDQAMLLAHRRRMAQRHLDALADADPEAPIGVLIGGPALEFPMPARLIRDGLRAFLAATEGQVP